MEQSVHPLRWTGRKLARYLSEPRDNGRVTTSRPDLLAATLRKGDVLLVEGTSRFAGAIRYITQSTWSHSALFAGVALGLSKDGENKLFIEAALIAFAAARIGNQYDVRNVVDLARYLIRSPPVPDRYKRRLLALGSGEPTRAICSSLIAAAFASVRYPVLPEVEIAQAKGTAGKEQVREILHIRDSRLYAPRDFDVSPYFRIVKPSLQQGFDPHALDWAPPPDPG